MEVERAANRARLRERAPLPEKLSHLVPGDVVDPRRDRELRAGLQLRVDAADVAYDLEQTRTR
ncbi:MAG TPA: hypothetical protein VFI01_11460 [Gaiellaceae bacterium]|nr:hypothetical protein [Gaiellaceae bacterium]